MNECVYVWPALLLTPCCVSCYTFNYFFSGTLISPTHEVWETRVRMMMMIMMVHQPLNMPFTLYILSLPLLSKNMSQKMEVLSTPSSEFSHTVPTLNTAPVLVVSHYAQPQPCNLFDEMSYINPSHSASCATPQRQKNNNK